MAASGPSAAGPASELAARVVSALVLALAALLAAYEGGRLFALFWLIAGIAVLYEWTSMARTVPRLPLQTVLSVCLASLALAYVLGWALAAGVALGLLGGLAAALVARTPRDRFWALTGFAYAAVLVVVPLVVRDHPELGIVGLLWMFAVVWTTDVAAFFVGRAMGGPKLWPRVSPKKTWSGFFGGLVVGTLSGLLVALLAVRFGWTAPISLVWVLVLSAFASIVSQAGDLGESALKRRFDVKDSSHLIPGHGGVLDRIDGFWAVALLVGAVLLVLHFR